MFSDFFMKIFQWFLAFSLLSSPLFATFVGNGASPILYKKGLALKKPHVIFRTSYLYDDLYHGRFRDKFKIQGSTPSHIAIESNLALATITLKKHADFYGYVGGSRLTVDNTVFASSHISWGGGVKLLFYHFHEWTLSADAKYFSTKPKIPNLYLDQKPAALLTPFALRYEEWQGAFLLSYAGTFLSPYTGLTYLFATITPDPDMGLLKMSGIEDFIDFHSKAGENRHKWGMVLGISLLAKETVSLTLETRFFGQNAFTVSGDVRF
jgi:hypothetical protein